MRLLVEFSHPAQVHKFKHALLQLQDQGVQVLILSRDKDVMLPLLDELPLRHRCLSKARSSMPGMAWELLVREWRTLLATLRFRPDLMLSAHSVAITHVGWLLRIPRLVHEDTEFGKLQQRLYMPFATRILTTTAYYLDWGPRQMRIPSLEPLAYLHPNRFTPDPARLARYGLGDGTRYAVVRMVAWQALHDRGLQGMAQQDVLRVVEQLRGLGFDRVVLSAEAADTPIGRDDVVIPRPEDLHHLLALADLCLSESITVAGEAAVFGTPTLLVNPLRAGHTLELERYGLIERLPDLDQALARAEQLCRDSTAEATWRARRARLLADKSDMTEDLVAAISRALQGAAAA